MTERDSVRPDLQEVIDESSQPCELPSCQWLGARLSIHGLIIATLRVVWDAFTTNTLATTPSAFGREPTRASMWQRGARTNTGAVRPTAREMNNFIDANPQIRTSADVAARYATRTFLPASVIGLCHWLFSPLDPDEADWFLARVADGDGVAADSPIAALRLRIVKLRVGGGRVNETEALALMILAWNAHRAGGSRSKLQMPKGGLTPENFPEPR